MVPTTQRETQDTCQPVLLDNPESYAYPRKQAKCAQTLHGADTNSGKDPGKMGWV